MKRISLQARVLLLAICVILAISLLDLASTAYVQVRDAEQRMADQARSIGSALVPSLQNDLVVGDLATAQQTLDRVQSHAFFKRLDLLDAASAKVLLAGRQPEATLPENDVPGWFARLVDIRPPPLSIPIQAGGVQYGVLLVEPSPAMLERDLWRQLWLAALLSLITLAVVLPLFILTLRGGLKPLRELAASARKFGAGDYTRRAPDSTVREIAQTARAFNRMADNIQTLLGQLRASNATNRRLAVIVEQSGEIILTLNNAGIITSWNAGASRTLGYTAEESIDRNIAFLLPETGSDKTGLLARQFEDAQAGDRHEMRLRAKDGRTLDIALGLAPLLDDDGNRVGLICIGRDFTERKRAQDEIRRINAELEQRVWERTAELEAANQELEAFSYTVSHDLRAPLRALNGFSKLVEEDAGDTLGDQARHMLQRIRAASLKMEHLIDELLKLARLGRQELQRADTNLSGIAEEIRAELAEAQPDRRVSWHIEPGLTARADRVLIRSVLDNLLRNAWKFTSKREDAEISFTSSKQRNETVYCVRDNGAGFNPAYAGKLFLPFQRLHKAEQFEGTGIGLATVHRIVKRHGGRIWAEGAVDQGAAFRFTLP
jgi:PAS domain S-box-containing protein